jgi:hypothetical protein
METSEQRCKRRFFSGMNNEERTAYLLESRTKWLQTLASVQSQAPSPERDQYEAAVKHRLADIAKGLQGIRLSLL